MVVRDGRMVVGDGVGAEGWRASVGLGEVGAVGGVVTGRRDDM